MKTDFQSAMEARDLMDRLVFMNLATASRDAVPWNSPVFYTCDEDLNFYWLSSPDAQHSRNIRENPNVSIVIFDSTKADGDGLGVYFSAVAAPINEDDRAALQKAHDVSYKRAGKEPVDAALFTGDFPRKYYRAAPVAAWTNSVEVRNGINVDVRKEIPLDMLRSLLRP
jgi:nitroimidazol reductase NimA-like FMN-containing flavoprotein (pyridoxamine 5'-phosphate oxidase superfamily)